ncbi:MAG: LysE family translocator [Legionellales bacterium]|nr:LysE family translocator [Legionellales bacterium]
MLPDYSHLVFFLTTTVLLNILPGSDVLYIGSQSLYDQKQGIFAALGISTGIAFYIVATALGLTAILQSSSMAFNIIKIIGAIYLLYLAYNMFTQKESPISVTKTSLKSKSSAYYKGVYTNILNPKVGIFFVTFLPQFISPSQGSVGLQLLSLGIIFLISGTLVNLIYVFLFTQVRHLFIKKPHLQKWLNKLTGSIFCLIALMVITSKQEA